MCMKFILFIFSSLLFVVVARSQEAVTDSQKTYLQREVVVTATRSQISVKDSPAQIDIISREELQHINGSTVADALEHSSSIFLKEYGASGALRTLSLRGGASEHILVLINGNRFNSFQNGLVDLSLLPVNDIEQIEVLHGGGSALYGADALGGVVNILTRTAVSDFRVRTEASSGSFGFEKYLLESQVRFGKVGILGGYASERSRDDFSFHILNSSFRDTSETRDNSDFTRRQFYVHSSVSPSEHSSLNLSAQYVRADRGTPGPYDPFYMGVARQSDDDANFSASYSYTDLNGVEWRLTSNVHYNFETYNDPNPFFPYQTFYKNIYTNVNPQVRLKLSDYQTLILGGEFGEGTLDGPDFDSKITRVQKAMYVSSESQFDFNRQLFNRILLYQTIRYDRVSDVDFALTPKFGINVRFTPVGDIRLRASIGQNFRSPSFNDLYYRGFSNPNLKPEHSTSFDAGFSSAFSLLGENTLEYTYFHLDTDDRILFDPSTFLPVNIGKVLSTGSEVKYTGSFFDGQLNVGVKYSFTDARKRNVDYPNDPTYDRQLVYIPTDNLNITLAVRLNPVTLSLNNTLVGGRYLTADNTASLPSYRLTNANVVVNEPIGTLRILAKAEVNNILDNDYEVFKQYPMPKRNYRVTLGVEY